MKPVNLDSDFSEDVYLPSPNQLKYKILIKNKKLQPSQSSKQRVIELIFRVLPCLLSLPKSETSLRVLGSVNLSAKPQTSPRTQKSMKHELV